MHDLYFKLRPLQVNACMSSQFIFHFYWVTCYIIIWYSLMIVPPKDTSSLSIMRLWEKNLFDKYLYNAFILIKFSTWRKRLITISGSYYNCEFCFKNGSCTVLCFYISVCITCFTESLSGFSSQCVTLIYSLNISVT